MSLRVRLLLLSLFTLLLPWAGCKYAQQMENVLRTGQEESLLTTAGALARVVGADTEFLTAIGDRSEERDAATTDLFAVQLTTDPLLDGFADEWPIITRPAPQNAEDISGLKLGIYGSALYAFLHVSPKRIVYDTFNSTVANANDANSIGDAADEQPVAYNRIIILARDPSHSEIPAPEHAWSISAVAPGPIIVRRAVPSAPWLPQRLPQSAEDAEIRGFWRASDDGFDVELRIPQRLLGAEIAIFPQAAIATTGKTSFHRIVSASESLRNHLNQYIPSGVRLSVLNADGWMLAQAGSLNGTAPEPETQPSIYRLLLGRNEVAAPTYGLPYGMWAEPIDSARRGHSSAIWFRAAGSEPSIVRAAVPIMADQQVLGVVAVEQGGEQLLVQRDAALDKLLNFAVIATSTAVVASLFFSIWLSRRIRRLSRAAAHALSADGRVEPRLPDTHAHDELGDLARSYATLLQRFNEYTQYLQTLGAKLTHEIRTPLAIVSSSLENLAAEHNSANAPQYLERARDGANRLHSIISAMSEATRVEQSIEQAERVEFDLAALVNSSGHAYQQTFTGHRVAVRTPTERCQLLGAPELIAQLLDKLLDNAADFCPPNGRIEIELAADAKYYRLSVSNEGPPLPKELADKLFDLMVSGRSSERSRPHLGLGLYIVQLIVRFHHGQVDARNLIDEQGKEHGVTFEIALPRHNLP